MATLVCARCGSPELDFQLAARVCDACAGQPWHDAVGPDACGAVRALHQRCQTQGIGPEAGQLLVEVLRFARTLMMAKGEVVLEPTQTEEVIDIVENLLDAAGESTLSRRLAPATNRSSDGILQADTGVFRFFDGGTIPPLENALRDIPAEFWGAQQHWMCPRCKRPTSDDYLEHMQLRHPGMSSIQVPPASLTAEDVARCLEERSSMAPACMLYTMETPLYRASNKAMREWGVSPEAFAPFQGFAMRLDSELKGMEEYVGYAYRAVDCSMPNGLYDKGAVVTWNQPSSASTSPRVAKLFMQGGGLDLRGTLFIIRSLTARPIAKFSVHPEEAEVLFRAGTQFLVQSRADLGVKGLLEVVMRCSLQQVDVYELVELRLRRWADVLQYLDPSDALRNTELVNLIRKIESTPRHHLHSAPLSTLIHREHDKATAVHLAAAVPQNATCLRLVAAALGPADFAVRDALGRTALHVAVDSGHSEAALFLLHRGAPLDLLTGSQLLKAAPWVGQHGRDELLFQLRDLLRSDEQFRQLVHQQPTAMHPGLRVVCEYRSAAIVEQMLIRELTGHQFSGLALAAARRANFPVVALLLTRQADPNAADDAGMSLLQHAAAAGPLSLLETLLQLGADVHHTDHDGQTALMHATSQSRVDAAQLLLGAGAAVGPISAHSTGGVTALALAAERGCLELVEVLLAAGASQELSTAQSWTPLMMAAKGGRLAILQTLLAAGGDANAAGFGGRAPLYFAAEAGHVAGVQALLAAGADANARGADGRTALMAAAQQEHMAALEVLLRARACVALGDRGGTTALMHAARSGAAAAVAMLLQAKADVNARYGAAPALVYACESGHVPAVKALLQAEADVAMATPTGTTALTVAYQYGHGAVIDLLRSTGADLVPLHGPGGRQALAFACRSGAVTSVERMLAANVDVNAPDAAGRTPLMHAAGGDVEAAAHPLAAPTSVADGGHLRVLDLLLDGGADVDAEDAEGRTALAHAAIEGHTALVQRLLRAKADAHSVDHEGHTPMMHAAREGHVNVIEALLEAGADVDYTRQRPTVSFLPSRAEGWTALMSAAQGGRLEAAKRLLRARADLWAVNVDDTHRRLKGGTSVASAMWTKYLFLCLVYSLGASGAWVDRIRLLWDEHKEKFLHRWNVTEELARFKCFAQNVAQLDAFNAEKEDGAQYGLNKFAHLCHDEFRRQYTGLLAPALGGNRTRNPVDPIDHQEALRLSQESVDWRKLGAVTHVKDQGQCGSCWAFSAVGNMEGLNFLKTGSLVELSEEELVQCSKGEGNLGCGGGLMDYAFDWVAKNGIAAEGDYPYTSAKGTDGKCQQQKVKNVVAKFSGHVDLPHDEVQMAAWVAKNGPLSVSVDAGPKWQLYHSGIKTSCFAGHPDHGVLIVGFGEEKGTPYWIVKNSWGPQWGEEGYIRIKRGANCNSIRGNPSSAKL